jgi:hypothetical protein
VFGNIASQPRAKVQRTSCPPVIHESKHLMNHKKLSPRHNIRKRREVECAKGGGHHGRNFAATTEEAGYEQYPEELRGEHAGSSRHFSFKNKSIVNTSLKAYTLEV